MKNLVRLLISIVFSFSSSVYAANSEVISSIQEKQGGTPQSANTAEALAKAPQCDDKLVRELQGRLTKLYCLANFDHYCWSSSVKTALAVGGVGGTAAFGSWMMERRAEVKLWRAKALLDADGAVPESVKSSMQNAMDSSKKFLLEENRLASAEEMRARAIQAIDGLGSESELMAARASLSDAGAAAARLAKYAKYGVPIRYAGGIASGAGLLVLGYDVYQNFTLPAGSKCNDNGMAYVDYQEGKDGKCEFAFDLNGSKFRSFFRQSEESQRSALRDPETCRYLSLFNEGLNRDLTKELQKISDVDIKKLPVCRKGDQPGEKPGMDYNMTIAGIPYALSTTEFKETQHISAIKISQTPEKSDSPIKGEMTVQFRDDGKSSVPYRVTGKDASGRAIDMPFKDFLKDKNNQKTIQVLNASTVWTPTAAAGCHKSGKEQEDYWIKALPGLKTEEAAKGGELPKTTPTIAPPTPPANPPKTVLGEQ